eukprot:gene63869-87348_t
MEAVIGCPYHCAPDDPSEACQTSLAKLGDAKKKTHKGPVPVVDLPLGATEDRVVGALDLEKALAQGIKAFEPGLLARANRGFLYVDEVNLLEDHLVDLLIDEVIFEQAAATRKKASFGRRLPVLGPLENADMVGSDLTLAIHQQVLPYIDSRPAPSPLLEEMVKQGKLGFKSGEGFRTWSFEEQNELRRK